jgi:hypothetical protein
MCIKKTTTDELEGVRRTLRSSYAAQRGCRTVEIDLTDDGLPIYNRRPRLPRVEEGR